MVEATEATRRTILREEGAPPRTKGIIDYITVLKPRETVLLVFIGICSAVVAGQGSAPWDVLLLALAALTAGSAGANGITNYLDNRG